MTVDEDRRTLAPFVAGIGLGLPVYIQITDRGLGWAQGHIEARQFGFYLPLLSPLVVAWLYATTSRSFDMERRSWTLRHLIIALVAVLIAAYVYGLTTTERATALRGLPFLAQMTLPIVVLLALLPRFCDSRFLTRMLHGFEAATLGTATLAMVVRPFAVFEPSVGYPDDFGALGIPTSLRFFPTLVSVAVVALVAEVITGRSSSLYRVDPLARTARFIGLSGGIGLILVAHSRTAMLGVVVGGALFCVLIARRSTLVVGALLLVAVGAIAVGPTTSASTSLSRLVTGAGEADENRFDRVKESFAATFSGPFGLAFVPSEEVATREGVRIERVVTAENQLGTFGASAGVIALALAVVILWQLARISWRCSMLRQSLPLAMAVFILCVSCLWQITMTNLHLGLVFAVFAWSLVASEAAATTDQQTSRDISATLPIGPAP